MPKNTARGFTIIELLIVITIIGMLVSIVLASLSNARSKGNDSRIASDLMQIRDSLDSGRGYTLVYPDLTTDAFVGAGSPNWTNINAMITDATTQNGGTSPINVKTTAGNGGISAYALYAQLKVRPGFYYCIDSTGRANPAANPNTGQTCP